MRRRQAVRKTRLGRWLCRKLDWHGYHASLWLYRLRLDRLSLALLGLSEWATFGWREPTAWDDELDAIFGDR
jgi:hypothetical protein